MMLSMKFITYSNIIFVERNVILPLGSVGTIIKHRHIVVFS